jgi:hypothetical protein
MVGREDAVGAIGGDHCIAKCALEFARIAWLRKTRAERQCAAINRACDANDKRLQFKREACIVRALRLLGWHLCAQMSLIANEASCQQKVDQQLEHHINHRRDRERHTRPLSERACASFTASVTACTCGTHRVSGVERLGLIAGHRPSLPT